MARAYSDETFWARIYSQVERVGDCLLFTGHRVKDGYGHVKKDGKMVLVHRAVWARDNGPIPDGLIIMHTCDTPACIEPKHLQLGTHADNSADRDRKGRRAPPRGSINGRAILCENDIPIIRYWLKNGYQAREIADKFLVDRHVIFNIKYNRCWQHVGPE